MTTRRVRACWRSVVKSGGVLVAVLAVMLPSFGVLGTSPATAAAFPDGRSVTIVRDSDGIPHITAGNFIALGYGEAWAFSQDNLCTLAQDFVTVNGERSRYFGAGGLAINYSAGAYDTNLKSDYFWQSVKKSGIAVSELRQPAPNGPLPQVLAMLKGFVAGYNAYLASGRLDDPTCKGKPWVRPINLTDMFLRGYQIVTEASSALFISDEVSAAPPASTSSTNGVPNAAELLADFGSGGDDTLGSNGIGLGAQDTANADGMVLANPHFPWMGTERFWMVQLTVPGQYNVMGGTLEGFPLVAIGFNQHLAWTHTVSTSFRFTFYQLKLVPGDPTSYYVDGHVEKMGRLTVRVHTAHGTKSHTFYTTRWGRVLDVSQAGYKWTTTTAYAVDDATATDTARAANQYLRMGQTTSVQQLLSVEGKYLGIPTFNTIASDDTGHTYYGDVGNTPNVPQSLITECLPSGAPQLVFSDSGVVTLDGSRGACAWSDDPGTPIPGIFSATNLPHTIRTDYVENSNDSYWLANPSSPFPAYSPIVGDIDTEQGPRTRLGNEMIAERVAGTDGLGAPKFTISSLQRMWESDQSLVAQLVLSSLIDDCRSTSSVKATNGKIVELAPACAALSDYSTYKNGDLNAKGGWLFSEWAVQAPSSNFWSDAFNPAQPLTTPSRLDTANPAMMTALADAVINLRSHGIKLDASYGQVQYAARNGLKIPIPGCSTGCFNAIDASDDLGGPLYAAPYGEVYNGSSLVMTTELTTDGPKSEGILTYSEAANPRSPWYSNMTNLYSKKEWVPLRFTKAELASDHGKATVTLKAT